MSTDFELFADRNYVKQLVANNDTRLRFEAHASGKSVVWKRFERVFVGDVETQFVKCKLCHHIQKNVHSGGTGGLLRHRCCETSDETDVANDANDSENDTKRSFDASLEHDLSYLLSDRHYMKQLIVARDPNVRFAAQKRKSSVWQRFERVFYNDFETLFVKCRFCHNIQKCNNSIGTGGLLRHRCAAADPQLLRALDCDDADDANADVDDDPINDKRLIRALIDANDADVRFASQSGKSEAWLRFERVFYRDVETPFVKCRLCHNVQKCDPTTGTGGPLRHRCPHDGGDCDDDGQQSSGRSTTRDALQAENVKLKELVVRCLSVLNRCRCFDEDVVDERKHINQLVKNYNKRMTDDDDDQHDCSDDKSFDDDSDVDPDYGVNGRPIKRKNTVNSKSKSNRAVRTLKPNLFLKNAKRVAKSEASVSFTCEWPGCGRVFKSKAKLNAHRDIHLEVKRYRCDWPGCDDAFLRKRQLISHVSAFHTNDRPFKCDWPGCDYASNYEKGLSRHRMTHTGEKPFACSWPSCEWTFRQQHHLSAHLLKHTGEKPFECEHVACDRKFSSRQAMRFHMEKAHKVANNALNASTGGLK